MVHDVHGATRAPTDWVSGRKQASIVTLVWEGEVQGGGRGLLLRLSAVLMHCLPPPPPVLRSARSWHRTVRRFSLVVGLLLNEALSHPNPTPRCCVSTR